MTLYHPNDMKFHFNKWVKVLVRTILAAWRENLYFRFPTRYDKSQAVQPQKMARGSKFRRQSSKLKPSFIMNWPIGEYTWVKMFLISFFFHLSASWQQKVAFQILSPVSSQSKCQVILSLIGGYVWHLQWIYLYCYWIQVYWTSKILKVGSPFSCSKCFTTVIN